MKYASTDEIYERMERGARRLFGMKTSRVGRETGDDIDKKHTTCRFAMHCRVSQPVTRYKSEETGDGVISARHRMQLSFG